MSVFSLFAGWCRSYTRPKIVSFLGLSLTFVAVLVSYFRLDVSQYGLALFFSSCKLWAVLYIYPRLNRGAVELYMMGVLSQVLVVWEASPCKQQRKKRQSEIKKKENSFQVVCRTDDTFVLSPSSFTYLR